MDFRVVTFSDKFDFPNWSEAIETFDRRFASRSVSSINFMFFGEVQRKSVFRFAVVRHESVSNVKAWRVWAVIRKRQASR